MPEITRDQGRLGIKGVVNQRLDIVVNRPGIEILIGGPYALNGELHAYGHVAIRAISPSSERVYDFGRYGDSMGPYGDGILRIWRKFDKYIAGENFTGRTTSGFLYETTPQKIKEIDEYYTSVIKGAARAKSYPPHMEAYKLSRDYHAVDNNCTTTSLAGARIALPKIEYNTPTYNRGRGLSSAEQKAVRLSNFGSWPERVFMPEDLRLMLENNSVHKPAKISTYGGSKK